MSKLDALLSERKAIEETLQFLEKLGLWAEITVAVGIILGVVVLVCVQRTNPKLRDKLAEIDGERGRIDAQKDADAKAKSQELQGEIAAATLKSDGLRRDSEQLKKDVALANQAAEEAKEKAESERLARIKLEERYAWRIMSDEKMKFLTQVLSLKKPMRVDVFVFNLSPEIANIGTQIVTTMSGAKWRPRIFIVTSSAYVVGDVVVSTKAGADKEAVAQAQELQSGLNFAGVAAYEGKPFPEKESPFPKDIFSLVTDGAAVWDANDIAPIRVMIGMKNQAFPTTMPVEK